MKKYLHNWKTTSAGILSVIGGIVLYVSDHTKINESAAAILAGVGLIFASDATSTVN